MHGCFKSVSGERIRASVLACVAAATLVLAPSVATAEADRSASSPAQLSLWTPIQFPYSTTRVRGVRLNLLYGAQEDLEGLDLGILNRVTSHMQGVQLGVVDVAEESAVGVQVGIRAYVGQAFTGLQVSLLNEIRGEGKGAQTGMFNMVDTLNGVQGGLVNTADVNFDGLQVALFVNGIRGAVKGAQVSGFNRSGQHRGVQLGFTNSAESLVGVQIGIVNIHSDGFIPILPFVNVGW